MTNFKNSAYYKRTYSQDQYGSRTFMHDFTEDFMLRYSSFKYKSDAVADAKRRLFQIFKPIPMEPSFGTTDVVLDGVVKLKNTIRIPRNGEEPLIIDQGTEGVIINLAPSNECFILIEGKKSKRVWVPISIFEDDVRSGKRLTIEKTIRLFGIVQTSSGYLKELPLPGEVPLTTPYIDAAAQISYPDFELFLDDMEAAQEDHRLDQEDLAEFTKYNFHDVEILEEGTKIRVLRSSNSFQVEWESGGVTWTEPHSVQSRYLLLDRVIKKFEREYLPKALRATA